MRGRAFLLLGALCGCGLVSGLDGLEIGDGSAPDATSSTDASDAGQTLDAATVDATDAGTDAPPPVVDGSVVHCGPNLICNGQTCCVGTTTDPYTYVCASKDCGPGTAAFYCDDKSDCSGAGTCCFANNGATCVATSSCVNRLCASAQQCGNNAQCVPFDAGFGMSLSRCQ